MLRVLTVKYKVGLATGKELEEANDLKGFLISMLLLRTNAAKVLTFAAFVEKANWFL